MLQQSLTVGFCLPTYAARSAMSLGPQASLLQYWSPHSPSRLCCTFQSWPIVTGGAIGFNFRLAGLSQVWQTKKTCYVVVGCKRRVWRQNMLKPGSVPPIWLSVLCHFAKASPQCLATHARTFLHSATKWQGRTATMSASGTNMTDWSTHFVATRQCMWQQSLDDAHSLAGSRCAPSRSVRPSAATQQHICGLRGQDTQPGYTDAVFGRSLPTTKMARAYDAVRILEQSHICRMGGQD